MFRPATIDDARLLFEWVNDPATRAMSRESDPVLWEDHLRWFEGVLADPGRVIWIWVDGDTAQGSIRFTSTDDGRAWVAYQVAPECRGHGLGGRLLASGTALYAHATGRIVDGFVKQENATGQHVIRAAGYEFLGDRDDGMTYFEYVPRNRVRSRD